MTRKFTSIWNDRSAGRVVARTATRRTAPAGVTSAETDSESGNEGPATRQALHALDVMFQRGHLPKEEYERRRAALLQAKD